MIATVRDATLPIGSAVPSVCLQARNRGHGKEIFMGTPVLQIPGVV